MGGRHRADRRDGVRLRAATGSDPFREDLSRALARARAAHLPRVAAPLGRPLVPPVRRALRATSAHLPRARSVARRAPGDDTRARLVLDGSGARLAALRPGDLAPRGADAGIKGLALE